MEVSAWSSKSRTVELVVVSPRKTKEIIRSNLEENNVNKDISKDIIPWRFSLRNRHQCKHGKPMLERT